MVNRIQSSRQYLALNLHMSRILEPRSNGGIHSQGIEPDHQDAKTQGRIVTRRRYLFHRRTVRYLWIRVDDIRITSI